LRVADSQSILATDELEIMKRYLNEILEDLYAESQSKVPMYLIKYVQEVLEEEGTFKKTK
jgi:hypothetical protein